MQITEGSVVAGRYRLVKQLARGGMGSVWIARHLQLDSNVAVKFMDAGFAASPAARVRFEREAKSAAQLHSPHVVTIHDYGIEGDTPFLVMELLKGEDLGVRIKRLKSLSPETTAGILTHVARALRLAHDAGIVHRDLKPGNIFLTDNDDSEIAKVLDFGIAKMMGLTASVDEEIPTKSDQILGSPQYMSPEQVRRSRDVDHRTDVWAVGVIAYRALTGKLPFTGDSIGEVLVKIVTEAAPPPSSHVPALPLTIDRFFERALAKLPEHRFQTAPELSAAFARAAGLTAASDPEAARPKGEKRFGMRTIPVKPADVAAAVHDADVEPPTTRGPSVGAAPSEAEPTRTPTPFVGVTEPMPAPGPSSPGDGPPMEHDGTTQPRPWPEVRSPSPSSSGVHAATVSPELFGGATPSPLSMSSRDLTTTPLPLPPAGAPSASASRARTIGILAVAGLALAFGSALLTRAFLATPAQSISTPAAGGGTVSGSPAVEVPAPTAAPTPASTGGPAPSSTSTSTDAASAAAPSAAAPSGKAPLRPLSTAKPKAKPTNDPLGHM